MSEDTKTMIAHEAMRQTEIRLDDLLKNGHAADQRAFTFAAIAIGAAGIFVSPAANAQFPVPSLLGCIGIILGALICILSALPQKFHVKGHYYKDWAGHIDDEDNLFQCYSSQGLENDERIQRNEDSLEKAGRVFKIGVLVSLTSSFS